MNSRPVTPCQRIAVAAVLSIMFVGLSLGPADAAERTVPVPSSVSAVARPAAIPGKTLVSYGSGWAVFADGVTSGVSPLVETGANSQAVALGTGNTCNAIGNCRLYIYRGTTRTIANAVARYENASSATIAGVFALACAGLGGIGATVCAVVGAVIGGYAIDQFIYARDRNQCIQVRYQITPGGVIPFNISPYNGSACRN